MIPLVVGEALSVPVAGARGSATPKILSEIASCAGECVQLVRCPVGKPQPWIICLSPLPELQCLTPCLAWVRWSGICAGCSRHLVAGLPPPVLFDKVWDVQAFLIAIPGLICCARLIWLQGLVIIYACQGTCTQAKLVRGPDPHGFNPLPPKDLIL